MHFYEGSLLRISVGDLVGELAGRNARFPSDSGGGRPPELAGEDACVTLSLSALFW